MRRAIAILLCLCALSSLGAESVRIGLLVNTDYEAFTPYLTHMVSTLASSYATGRKAQETVIRRLNSASVLKWETELHAALVSEKEKLPLRPKVITSSGNLKAEIVPIAVTEAMVLPLSRQDSEVYRYLMLANSLDMLFYAECKTYDTLLYYRLRLYDPETGIKEVTRVSRRIDLFKDAGAILKEFQPLLAPGYFLLCIDNPIDGLSISEKGVTYAMTYGYIMLPEGVHDLTFSALHHVEKKLMIAGSRGEEIHLSGELDPIILPPAAFSVTPSFATISLMGGKSESGIIEAPTQISPLVVSSSAPGFATKSRQYDKLLTLEKIELKPEWMLKTEGRVEKSKKSMYRALRNSLLLFGTFVATKSLANVYSDENFGPLLEIAGVAAGGLTILSAGNFAIKCVAYFHTAQQTFE